MLGFCLFINSVSAQVPTDRIFTYPLGVAWTKWKGAPPGNAIIGWALIPKETFDAWDPHTREMVQSFSIGDLSPGTIRTCYEASDEPLSPAVFAAVDGWCLVYSSGKNPKWLWIRCDYRSIESWIESFTMNRYVGGECPGGRWDFFSGDIVYVSQQNPKHNAAWVHIFSSKNEHASPILQKEPWWPDYDWGNPKKPIFKKPKTKNSISDNAWDWQWQLFNQSKLIQRAVVIPVAVQENWLKVIPARYDKGLWRVSTDEGDILLVQWDLSHSGWLKWRVPGPVYGSFFVTINTICRGGGD